MSLQKNISKYWNYLEQKHPSPKYVGQVKSLKFNDLKNAIDSKNEIYLKKIIRNMYVNKEAYILRNVATKKLKEAILDLTSHYKKTRKESFYKMLNGTPNFHRVYDENVTKKYSLCAIKHSFFFYNWNVKSK